jgi:hypothetical protein
MGDPATPNEDPNMDFIDARSGRKRGHRSTALVNSKHSKSLDGLDDIVSINTYHVLSDGPSEGPPLPPLKPKPAPRNNTTENSSAVINLEGKPKRKRVPSVPIKWAVTEVRNQLARVQITPANYLLKQVYGATVVKNSNLNDYHTLLTRCIDQKLPYFTHALDTKKSLRIVLLGLPNMNVDDLKESLAEKGVNPDEIKPMNIKNSKFIEHNNFILYFPRGSISIGKLREIKSIDHVIVKWVYYDSKRHALPSVAVANHGDTEVPTELPPACVKCAGAHETDACPVSRKGVEVLEQLLKCANCKLKHAANYGGCPVRQKFINSRITNKVNAHHRPKNGHSQRNQHYSTPQHLPILYTYASSHVASAS